jgi:hypothetical protein
LHSKHSDDKVKEVQDSNIITFWENFNKNLDIPFASKTERSIKFPDSNRSSIHEIQWNSSFEINSDSEFQPSELIAPGTLNKEGNRKVENRVNIFNNPKQQKLNGNKKLAFLQNTSGALTNSSLNMGGRIPRKEIEKRIDSLKNYLCWILDRLCEQSNEKLLEVSFSDQNQMLEEDSQLKMKYNEFIHMISNFEERIDLMMHKDDEQSSKPEDERVNMSPESGSIWAKPSKVYYQESNSSEDQEQNGNCNPLSL